jgi:tungstate transport system permease protein
MEISAALREAFILLFTGDKATWEIILVSLKTSLLGLILVSPVTVVVGYWIATHNFKGRAWVIWLIQSSLSLPTVLIGLLLYMMLSRHGPLGMLGMLFTQSGLILGQMLIAAPVLLAFTLSAVQGADRRIAETAVTLGAPPLKVMMTMLYEVRFGVVAAIINGFSRTISEVGCAMMVGGNIESSTRTITTAIALETSKGEFAQGIALGLLLVTVALVINAVLLLLQGEARNTGVVVQ